MPTIAGALEQLKQAYADTIAALAADAANPQPSYKLEGEEMKRTEWRQALCQQLACLRQEILILEATAGGPSRIDVLVRHW
jgi:hypothetical protein